MTALLRLILLLICLFGQQVLADVKVFVNSGLKQVDENVLAHLGTIRNEELSNQLLLRQRVLRSAESALNALGFYDSDIVLNINSDNLNINVSLSEPVIYKHVDVLIKGPATQLAAFQELLDSPLMKSGERLQHWQYEKTKATLTQLLSRFGFMDAYLEQAELSIDLTQRQANAVLSAISGERYRFGDIQFEQDGLSDNLLRRMLTFETDDLYDNDKVAELRKSLSLSGYFDDVQVLVKKQPGKKVDVKALLKVKKSHYIDVGLGYSTDSGPRGRLGWRWPASGEFGGALSAQSEISEPKTEVVLNYRIPLKKPLTQSLDFDYGWEDKKVENTRTIVTSVSSTLSNVRENNWQHRYGIGFDYERHSAEGDDTEKSFYLVPTMGWSRSQTDHDIDPQQGYFVNLSLSGSHPGIGSDTQFLKGKLSLRGLSKIYSPRLVLVGRLDLGIIWTDNLLQVPFSRRFFAGGDQSIRGFEYESIASRDEEGNLIGGKYLNIASAELNYRWLDDWRLGVFFDAGRAFNDFDEPVYSSLGPSTRWLSPIGQVRLDLAFPLKGEESSNPRVHISMGGVF